MCGSDRGGIRGACWGCLLLSVYDPPPRILLFLYGFGSTFGYMSPWRDSYVRSLFPQGLGFRGSWSTVPYLGDGKVFLCARRYSELYFCHTVDLYFYSPSLRCLFIPVYMDA